MLPDAATTWSAERPPPLIACKSLFSAGFNPVVFILLMLLVLLVPIVVFAFMTMVVDNKTNFELRHSSLVNSQSLSTTLIPG
jgi:hypothetical protein